MRKNAVKRWISLALLLCLGVINAFPCGAAAVSYTHLFQTGVGSFAIAASNVVGQDAVDLALQIPPKHYAAFELPVIADLQNRRICHMQRTPMWGALLWKDIRNFATACAKFE